MLIAHISDLHVRPRGKAAYRVSETNMFVERAIDALAALRPRPDLVLISGDLTDCGLPEEYEQLALLLRRLDLPILAVLGNHDRHDAYRAAFGERLGAPASGGFVQFAVAAGPLWIVGLDTVVPGRSEGALCAERLAFVEEALARGEGRPTLIVMHHPPMECGIAHMDRIRLLEGAEEFRAIVARHPAIERILCGHHHRPILARFGSAPCQVAPSVAHQVALDLDPGHEGALVFEPPAYLLHRWDPRTGIVTHQAYVERFPGPYPFVLDADYPGR
jgi:3',5'-cyclic-AMP phosphodiesterase